MRPVFCVIIWNSRSFQITAEVVKMEEYKVSTDENGIDWYSVTQNLHWYSDDDETFPFLCITINMYQIDKIFVSFDWKDQGWGNRKGYLQLLLKREDGSVASSKILSEALADHDWQKMNIEIDSSEDVIQQYNPGYTYEVMRHVGGGGGHQLFVNDFKLGFKGDGYGLK